MRLVHSGRIQRRRNQRFRSALRSPGLAASSPLTDLLSDLSLPRASPRACARARSRWTLDGLPGARKVLTLAAPTHTGREAAVRWRKRVQMAATRVTETLYPVRTLFTLCLRGSALIFTFIGIIADVLLTRSFFIVICVLIQHPNQQVSTARPSHTRTFTKQCH